MTKLFLDLDGVFADFMSKARLLFKGQQREGSSAWKVLENVPNLFLDLDPLPGGKESFDEIMSWGYPTSILTALPRPTKLLVTAADDKTTWVRKHLHATIPVHCSDGWTGKVKWCRQNDILVDDMQRNIDLWQLHGGIGIIHDGNWAKTLRKLRVVLKNQ